MVRGPFSGQTYATQRGGGGAGMGKLAMTTRRTGVVVVLGLLVAGAAGVLLGPSGALAASLPLVLLAYSSLLADRNALRGPGPALAQANAGLLAANGRLQWQVVHGMDGALRGAATAA